MGATKAQDIQQLAGNLVRLARVQTGLTQRQLAEAAGVPQSTVARVEGHRQQPTLPLLARLFAAAGLELRTRLEKYDDHDDVLDARRASSSVEQRMSVYATQDRLTEVAG